MTGVFLEEMNKYFGAVKGAYTEMTESEIRKMTYNVKAVIRDLLIEKLGYNNIPRVNVTENQSICFVLDRDGVTQQEMQCKFSKAASNEMTIYIENELAGNNKSGDIWYIYFKDNENKPYFGIMDRQEWLSLFPETADENEGFEEEVLLDGEDDLKAALSQDENAGYPMYNIKVDRGFYTVFELKRKYENPAKRIILDAEFQRESVWGPMQKAELVESILMGLPLPIFYFNQDKQGRLIVVDGRQRLTALFEFMTGKWKLKGLKVLKKLNEKKFSDLDPIVQSQIEDYQLQAHVLQPPTPDRIKFDIFDRVNRGGTKLNKQEIRNALYQGKATELLKSLAEDPLFAKATENAFVKDSRMKGKYILLRFISFELLFEGQLKQGKYDYKNDIDELLGLTMETINEMEEAEVAKIKAYTLKSLKNSSEIVGENAFRLIRKDGSRSPINMNVFEVVMHIMRSIDAFTKEDADTTNDAIIEMKKNPSFLDAIGNHRDNYNKVIARYEMANNIVKEGNAK